MQKEYEAIKHFVERCEEHPDHQTGIVTVAMLGERLFEEIDELREFIERQIEEAKC